MIIGTKTGIVVMECYQAAEPDNASMKMDPLTFKIYLSRGCISKSVEIGTNINKLAFNL